VNPGDVRKRILDQHARLREMLDELAPLATRFEEGEGTVGARLRQAALALYESFDAHLRDEERTLEPALRARGAEGCRMADRLRREHHEQDELLGYLLSRLGDNLNPTLLVAREVRHFIEYLRLDMAYEESTLLTAALLPDEIDEA
jgi:iron-sulfur cluster repair protein YtfE (RIC family)